MWSVEASQKDHYASVRERLMGVPRKRMLDVPAAETPEPVVDPDHEAMPQPVPEPLPAPRMTLARIMHEVCVKRKIHKVDLLSPRRDRRSVEARYEVMWRAKNETSLSLPYIGQRLGGKDHTTVLHGIRQYEKLLQSGRAK